MDKEKRYHILVQFEDDSFQWIKNTTHSEALSLKGVKLIKSYCNTNFEVCTKRWKVGASQFEKIVLV